MMKNSKRIKLFLLVIGVCLSLLAFSACTKLQNNTDEARPIGILSVSGLESTYTVGTSIDYSAVKVNVKFSDGETREIDLSVTTHSRISTDTVGDKEMKITYQDISDTFNIRVIPVQTVTQLSTPGGLRVDGNLLSWNNVKNADGYTVYVNDTAYSSNTNSYIFDLTSSGDATFRVVATSTNTQYTTSETSTTLVVSGIVKLNSPADFAIENNKLKWKVITPPSTVEADSVYYVIMQGEGRIITNADGSPIKGSGGEYVEYPLAGLNLGVGSYDFSVLAASTDTKVIQSAATNAVNYSVTRLAGPQNLQIQGTGTARQLTWNAVTGAEGYRIMLGLDASVAANVINVPAGTTSVNLSTNFASVSQSIQSGSVCSYDFYVFALGNGTNKLDSYISQSANFSISKLTTPSRVSAYEDVLSWDGVQGATGYKVFYKQDGEFSVLTEVGSDVTSIDLGSSTYNLTTAVYTFYIQAVSVSDAVINSDPSITAQYSYVVPLTMSDVTVTLYSSSARISWSQVANAQLYEVYTQDGICTTTTNSFISVFLRENNEQENDNESIYLNPGIYTFRVRANPPTGSVFDVSEFKTADKACTISKKLARPVVTANGTVMSWDEVDNAYAYKVTITGTYFDMAYIEDDTVAPTKTYEEKVVTVTDTSFDLAQLELAGNFTVRVKAVSTDGDTIYLESDNSAARSADVKVKLSAPVGITVSATGELSWTATRYANGYRIELINPDNVGEIPASVTSAAYAFEGITMQQGNYDVIIRATYSDADGSAVKVTDYVDPSDAVTYDYEVTNLDKPVVEISKFYSATGMYRVTWSAITGASSYAVYIDGVLFDADLTGVSVDLPATHFSVIGEHSVSVAANSACINRLQSAEGFATVKYTNAVTKPTGVAVESGTVKWTAVAGVEFYNVYVYNYNSQMGMYVYDKTVKVSVNNYGGFETGIRYGVIISALFEYADADADEAGAPADLEPTTSVDAFLTIPTANIASTYNSTTGLINFNGSINDTYYVSIYSAATGEQFRTSVNILNGSETFDVLNPTNSSRYPEGALTVRVSLLKAGTIDASEYKVIGTVNKLQKPIVSVRNGALVWTAVDNASGYTVGINGVEHNVSTNHIDTLLIPAGNTLVTVRATSMIAGDINSEIAELAVNKMDTPDIYIDITDNDVVFSWATTDTVYVVTDITTGESTTVRTGSSIPFANADVANYKIVAVAPGYIDSNAWQTVRSTSPLFEYGVGSQDMPYIVSTAAQFAAIGTFTSGYFRLSADIDLGDWTPLVVGNNVEIDGLSHSVSYAIIADGTASNLGLFSTNYGTVKNLNVTANITSASASSATVAGGIAGINAGTINNCTVSGRIQATSTAGGIAGKNSGSIVNSGNTATVTASSATLAGQIIAGGVVGSNVNGSVVGCYSMVADPVADIIAQESESANIADMSSAKWQIKAYSGANQALAGGIIGHLEGTSSVINTSYSYSNVYAETVSKGAYAGGFAGLAKMNVVVENCLAKGDVKAVSNSGGACAGGFIGNCSAIVRYCYSMGKPEAESVSGVVEKGGFLGKKISSVPVSSYYNVETSESPVNLSYESELALTTNAFKDWAVNCVGFSAEYWDFSGVSAYTFPHLIGERYLVAIADDGTYSFSNDAQNASGNLQHTIPLSGPRTTALSRQLTHVSNTDWLFELHEDIDYAALGSREIVPIAKFAGTIFGNGFTARNFTFTAAGYTEVGLIQRNYGLLDSFSVADFTISQTNSLGNIYAGALTALNYGRLVNCTASSGSIYVNARTGYCTVGGLVGENHGYIEGTVTTGDVSGYLVVADVSISGQSQFGKDGILGGLVGHNNRGYITGAVAKGNVAAVNTNWVKGGLVGKNTKPTNIYGAELDNIFSCYYSYDGTNCDEKYSEWGTGY